MAENKLSAVEAELYDRQIRLWGIESQEKLRAANVLLINIEGLGSEIAKNILLSGINSLTILDEGTVTEEELNTNFLLSGNSIGKKTAEEVVLKAQALNPLVKILSDTESVYSKTNTFFEKFTIIVATNIKIDFLLKLDKICRAKKIKLIYGDVFGTFGYSVADFQSHTFFEDKIILSGKKRKQDETEKTTVQVQSTLNYPELNKVVILPNTKQSVEPIKKTKRHNEYFFLMLVLIEFRNRFGRSPQYSKKSEDLINLKAILQEISELYAKESKLNDDVFDVVFGEVVPVCAIVGGIIAQEVIKAVSHKEVPIHNVFLFDPFTYDGKEMTVGV